MSSPIQPRHSSRHFLFAILALQTNQKTEKEKRKERKNTKGRKPQLENE